MREYGCDVRWRSQRDNPVDAAKQCNVTAMVMALEGSGIALPYTGGEQPEAHLARFAETNASVVHYQKTRQAWSVKAGWLPYTEQHTLAYAANLWVGSPDPEAGPVRYSNNTTLREIIAKLCAGKASVLTGRFTPGGHMVTAVGFETDAFMDGAIGADQIDLARVASVLIHDPWGDFHTGYTKHDGARCRYTVDELRRIVLYEGRDDKWAHTIA